jgi:hypothetical protein
MDWKDFLSHPISSISAWASAHERFFAVYVSGALAVVFFAVSVIFLLKSLGLL